MATRTDFKRASTADAMADKRTSLLLQAAIFLTLRDTEASGGRATLIGHVQQGGGLQPKTSQSSPHLTSPDDSACAHQIKTLRG